LLGASINIYEKRIENAWISTNLIHDKLARMVVREDPADDDADDAQRKDQNHEFLGINIEEFRDSKILDSVELENNLEAINKINITNFKKQFTDDPLFQRKLKTFDNTSLKGLLLNVFDVIEG
jgi:hypothetical protein